MNKDNTWDSVRSSIGSSMKQSVKVSTAKFCAYPSMDATVSSLYYSVRTPGRRSILMAGWQSIRNSLKEATNE